ncbi:MAG TPA: hypothetical protein VHJ54_01690 [Solirubrobacterales bacterium]|nr:hypothetical protein [Solirubrobacterales bacterium]
MSKAILILLAIGGLLLAACGDDDDEETTVTEITSLEDAPPPAEDSDTQAQNGSSGPSERDELGAPAPEQVVELVLTTTNPEDTCVPPHVTESYVKSAYGSASGCAQALQEGGPIAKSVMVEPVDDSGDSASTVAVASGGIYDGEDIEVRLVRQGEGWSVEAVKVDVPAGP